MDRYLGPLLVALLSAIVRAVKPPPSTPEIRRILAIKLHGIGNIVLLLPAVRQLRNHFSQAELDFFTFQSNAGILEGAGEITQCHFLDRRNVWTLVRSWRRVISLLRTRRYDLVVDFDQFAHLSAATALLTGAPRRIGFRIPTLCRHLAYTTSLVYTDTVHIGRSFSRLARVAGARDVPDISRRISVTPGERAETTKILEEHGIGQGEVLAVLHPGTGENMKLRRWPADRFAGLGDRLADELGCRVVISGGSEEGSLTESVRRKMRAKTILAAGRLSVKGFAALCERADFVVTNDTAAVHIASAMGTPVVGLYGPNIPFLYGPLGDRNLVLHADLPCSPCLSNLTSKLSRCRRARCMEEITVEEAFTKIKDMYFQAVGALPERSERTFRRTPPSEAHGRTRLMR